MNDFTNLRHKDRLTDEQKDWYHESMRNWRSWGSWFSWGSPVGLGLWFISLALAFWIVKLAINVH
jgi:hypothetical protein